MTKWQLTSVYLRDEIDDIFGLLLNAYKKVFSVWQKNTNTIMPGFTHLQTAQPVTFGHHLLVWFEMLVRDTERLQDCRKR